KESFASDAVRNISILTLDENAYKIIGYGSQRLRNFETIEAEDYQNVRMHFSTGYYVNYDEPDVKTFVFQFRALYGAEPNTYAFLGHDVASYFLESLNSYGRNFIYYLEGHPSKMMQSNLQLHRKENGGLMNEATINIVYQPDYRIEVQ
ncbi:MAG: hypothetical protein IJS02_05425, partial [Bacteroidales bacterium]|nr:hypothetical protein [Bacteroidales bacterium]